METIKFVILIITFGLIIYCVIRGFLSESPSDKTFEKYLEYFKKERKKG